MPIDNPARDFTRHIDIGSNIAFTMRTGGRSKMKTLFNVIIMVAIFVVASSPFAAAKWPGTALPNVPKAADGKPNMEGPTTRECPMANPTYRVSGVYVVAAVGVATDSEARSPPDNEGR